MTQTTKKIDWDALRRAYDMARDNGEDMLAWCTLHARQHNMSYGEFVYRLKR